MSFKRLITTTGLLLLPVMAFASESAGATASMTHRMMMLAMQLGVIIFAARLGNILLEKLHLPGVLGELLAGMLIGPYILGSLYLPGFPDGLFPIQEGFPVSPELYGICAVASILLLFTVGLETDIKQFMRYSVAGSLVGIGGVVVSFVLGDLMAVLFSPALFGKQLDFFSPACLFLGIISTATSVGITARILSEKKKTDSPEGVTILAGAVIDDVLGIILLAIGLGVIAASRESGGVDWAHIGQIAGKALGIWLAATIIGLVISRRISTLLKWFGDRSAIAVMGLGLALILAGLFEQAGLAMIVGAYVTGLSLSRTDINHLIRERLHPVCAFMVPVFFTVMGMLVDIRALASPQIIFFGILYTVVADVAKIIGCGVPALLTNFNLRGALRIGFGMLPRGEVTLIIAGVGLSAGVLNAEVFGVVVMMILVTAIIAPPVLVGLFRSPASGLRNAVEDSVSQPVVFNFPSLQAADLIMQRTLRVFESEGYFTHRVDPRMHLYQLRKDAVIMSVSREGENVLFECGAGQVPLVNTAMVEVIAELEALVRELRKPVNAEAYARKMGEQIGTPVSRNLLARYLSANVLVPELRGETKTEIIDELIDVLVAAGRVTDRAQVRAAIWQREASMSTGMQHGIAIPHGKTDSVSQLVCVVGLKADGVEFESIDGLLARIFVLTLSPKSASAPHVQFMSTISQILVGSGRTLLLSCRTREEMYAVLTGRTQAGAPRQWGLSQLGRRTGHAAEEQELQRFLRRDLLVVSLEGTTRAEVIDELLAVMVAGGVLKDPTAARAAVLRREEMMGTGLERGVAVPHARIDEVRTLVCAIGLQRDGVDFESNDGEVAKVIVLTLAPTKESGSQIEFMAALSRLFTRQKIDLLLASKTQKELWRALSGPQ